ncbi:MAG: alkaline phosphatase family protein [Bdellovibrionales bacterium]|nr:alkaline phosphatase family protein [Bdellovibrionales bacterium]
MKHFFVVLTFVIAGCSTGSKHLAAFDQALTKIQSSASEKGREELQVLCDKGLTGPCALLGKPAEARAPLSVLQSVTSDQQSRFVVVLPKSEKPLYFIRRAEFIARLTPERFTHGASRFVTEQIEAFALSPKEKYELLITTPGGELLDKRQFRALDVKRKRVRLALISCADDKLMDVATKMWPQLMAQKPDAMLWLGDNVYADRVGDKWQEPNPDSIWERYVQTRNALPVFKSAELIPVFATWDDHDYGRNDRDRTFEYKAQSLDIFFSFFAQRKPAPGFERGPGVASWWTAFGVQIALLDDRYFRSPNRLDVPDQTHFGVDQEKWIVASLSAARVPVLLASGDQFFGGYQKFESYEGNHPASFKTQLAEWRKAAKVPLLLISGDRHLTEIIKVPDSVFGYPTFEITSSPIHAKVFANALKDEPSPNQLVGMAGVYNYSILELMRAERGLLQASVQAFTLDNKLLYQKTLTVKRP